MSKVPELEALGDIITALSKLKDEEKIARIIRWAAEHFNVEPFTTGLKRQDVDVNDVVVDGLSGFPDIASLFNAANPITEYEKALVVGYWFQEVQGDKNLSGRKINDELKDLGHGIKNITRAISILMKRKPSLMIQTKKAGTTRQAPRTVKLTAQGISEVGNMLARHTSTED